MRITNELDNKIKVCIEKKYESELSAVRTDIRETKERKSKALADTAEIIITEHPEFEDFFKYCGFNSLRSNVENVYMNKIASNDSDIKELLALEQSIISKKKNEIENIKIQISYEKTFEDIKNVFLEHGFEF